MTNQILIRVPVRDSPQCHRPAVRHTNTTPPPPPLLIDLDSLILCFFVNEKLITFRWQVGSFPSPLEIYSSNLALLTLDTEPPAWDQQAERM